MAATAGKSKRYSLSRLAPDWRERIFQSIRSESLKLGVAVLSSTGCRPSELENGIYVNFREGHLRIAIHGSKVNAGRGQPLRMLTVDVGSAWGKCLVEKISQQTEDTILVKYSAAGISQRLREKSREIWPRRKTLVSAYCYRHYIGKSMKESGEPADKIARALGHASDFSQHVYGRAGVGKKSTGKHGIIDAQATIPVRHSAKTDRLSRFLNQTGMSPTIPCKYVQLRSRP